MTEKKRSQILAAIVVRDDEGKIIPLTDKNIQVIEVAKKLSLDLYKRVQETEGAFLIMI